MEKTVHLDLAAVLPGVPDERDGCVDRLVRSLETKDGVLRVHVETPDGV